MYIESFVYIDTFDLLFAIIKYDDLNKNMGKIWNIF